ncbi:unnamed protein product [Moneuplotes crassus]|uniref:Superoxide dismutase copper/zinc binding domain-containing protein n=1 Tax=Euplotes crassus TaxID=5936 RepID=A0AAD2D7D2_EUPCR|nr:unnamed protein product [Moneuplotes crassus]
MLTYLALPTTAAIAGYALSQRRTGDCDKGDTTVRAICLVNPEKNQEARGIVHFEQENQYAKTHIHGKFAKLARNHAHGFHIHAYGNLSQGCVTAGPHYNPHGTEHGGPFSSVRHVGDLGNVFSDSNGEATLDHWDSQVTLSGPTSVIGRACVLHKFTDDHGYGGTAESKKTGSAGPRIGCGVIGLDA